MVQKLFATVQGTFVTQRTNILGFVPFVNGEPPVEINVFLQPVRHEGLRHLGVHLSKSSLGSVDLDVSSASGGSEEVAEEGVALAAASSSSSPSPSPRGSGRGVHSQTEPLPLPLPLTATGPGPAEGPGGLASSATSATSPSAEELVARIKISNSFAIYDEDIIDLIAGEPETDPPPWLELETVIIDDLNFRTGEQLRILQVQVHCPETGEYFPPLEAALPRPRALR
jgi:hypothetical protein